MSHSLRLTIFFLRVVIGLGLFFVGFSVLFDHTLELTLQSHSLAGLYAWLSTPTPIASIHTAVFASAFLILGACITVGLFTRLTSIIAIILILASWLPAVNFSNFSPAQFINDEVIVLFALVVLVFGRAGHYLGMDTVTRFWKKRKS